MNRLSLLLHPAYLVGFRLGDLLRLLHRNRWRIDPVLWPRGLLAICGAAVTSVLSRFEPAWRTAGCEPPVFILGLARSGTTYLHQLLASHPAFSAPTRVECYNPHTFLLLDKLGLAAHLRGRPLHTRFIDNVRVGWSTPEEDEYGIFLMTGTAGYRSQVFPRNEPGLSSGLPARRDEAESLRWMNALKVFSEKVALAHGKRLVLKSPSHTFRIPEILRVYPDARFVTVLRDPIDHFRSFRAAFGRARAPHYGWGALQTRGTVPDRVLLDQIAAQIDRYVADRSLIPPGHLVEVRYEDLCGDTAGTINSVLRRLDLPAWPEVADRVRDENAGRPAYARNRHEPLPDELAAMVLTVYSPFAMISDGLPAETDPAAAAHGGAQRVDAGSE